MLISAFHHRSGFIMKIPLSWLKEYIDIDLTPSQIAKILTNAGLEVDSIERVTHGFEKVAVSEQHIDTVFEISLTPNLGHCSSVIGVARELSAATGIPVKLPKVFVEEVAAPIGQDAAVEVKEAEACSRYVCRLIKGVAIGPSPDWLKSRLEACGLRAVNNVVDVTNYVLLEMGHPLHAFDYSRLEGGGIIVRNARKGEKFVTLDAKERQLEETDLLICDRAKPVALAGIMGGLNSEVSDTTRDLLIESAYFSPNGIRKTSKRLSLMTDASKRFERGTDPNILIHAADRAVMLIQQVAGGEVLSGVIDTATKKFTERYVKCRLTRINKVLGTRLSISEVENIFNRLGMHFSWDGQDEFTVRIPTYRNDVHEEIDLIEEVARIYGFDNITQAASRFVSSQLPHAPIFLFEKELRSRLLGEGLQEFLTCDLIGPSLLNIVHDADMPEDSLVKVVNPTSIEQSILRTSLLPGLLQTVKYNWDHQNHDIAAFEIGRIHFKDGSHYKEQSVAGIVLSGKQRPNHWDVKARESNFYDLKGLVENLLSELRVADVAFKDEGLASFHPGRRSSVYAGSLKVGSLGEVHPSILRRLDVPQRILFAEINLHDLFQVRGPEPRMQEIPQYPGSERDWTLTLKEEIRVAEVFDAVHVAASPLLESTVLLDVYRSDKLGMGLKNITLRFLYRDRKKTISQEIVEAEHARIVTIVSERL